MGNINNIWCSFLPISQTNKNNLLYFWVFKAFNLRRCSLTRFTKRSEVLTVLMPYFVLLGFFFVRPLQFRKCSHNVELHKHRSVFMFPIQNFKKKITLGRELNFRDNATLSGMLKWRLVFSCMKNLLLFFLEMDIFLLFSEPFYCWN